MNLPTKVRDKILAEAKKNSRFTWHSGWESSSGYIASELRGDCRYGVCKVYIKWEKKKGPSPEQIAAAIEKQIDDLLNNRDHHQTQRDFTHYVLETFYIDLNRVKHEAMLSLIDSLSLVIPILEKADSFDTPALQELHNDLKNLECAISEHEAISTFLERGRKRVGES